MDTAPARRYSDGMKRLLLLCLCIVGLGGCAGLDCAGGGGVRDNGGGCMGGVHFLHGQTPGFSGSAR